MAEERRITVTGLMDFNKSPYHYLKWHIEKKKPDSKAMMEGRAFHLAVLEPEKFSEQVYSQISIPDGRMLLSTIPEFKEWLFSIGIKAPSKWKRDDYINEIKRQRDAGFGKDILLKEELDELYADKIQLTPWQMETIQEMEASVKALPFVYKYLCDKSIENMIEHSLEAEIEGVKVRGRIDWLFFTPKMDRYVIGDLKKCVSARRKDWERVIYSNNYYIQAWLYSELVRQNFGKDCLYTYIVCEGASPFIAEAYAADEGQLDAGEQLARLRLNQFKECLHRNSWPGYSDGKIQPCSLPKYAFDDISQILDSNEQL